MAEHPRRPLRHRHASHRAARSWRALAPRGLVAAVLLGLALSAAVWFGPGTARSQERALTATALKQDSVPEEYVRWLTSAAERCAEVTAPLLAAQIDVGSGWDATISDASGAVGPAQFMPSTWSEWGRDGDGDGDAQIRSVPDAVTAQADYLCWLTRAVGSTVSPGSRLDIVLAAYHAGPGTVRRRHWIALSQGTRAYVARVRSALEYYVDREDGAAARAPRIPMGSAGVAAGTDWRQPVPGARRATGVGRLMLPSSHLPAGVRLDAAGGARVVCVAAGVVAGVVDDRAGRSVVRVDHRDGTATIYGPLAGVRVRKGAAIAAGVVLGTVPIDQSATRFSVVVRGRAVDVQQYYRARQGLDVLGRIEL